MKREDLLQSIALKIIAVRQDGPVLVGIDGVDGAGKTTLADELVDFIGAQGRPVARASIDGFHRPREERVAKGLLSPHGYFEDSFDYPFLTKEFLEPLKAVRDKILLRSAKYDWKTESNDNEKQIEVCKDTVVLFEGVFLFREELNSFWDYRIYVSISPETSLKRGLARDSQFLGGAKETQEKYLKRYIPGQAIYHQQCQPNLKADVIIDNEDFLNPKLRSHPAPQSCSRDVSIAPHKSLIKLI